MDDMEDSDFDDEWAEVEDDELEEEELDEDDDWEEVEDDELEEDELEEDEGDDVDLDYAHRLEMKLSQLGVSAELTAKLAAVGIKTLRDLLGKEREAMDAIGAYGLRGVDKALNRRGIYRSKGSIKYRPDIKNKWSMYAEKKRLGRTWGSRWQKADSIRRANSGTLEFYIDPGNAPTEVIQAVLERLSDYHRAAGGLGIEFSTDDQEIFAVQGELL